MILRHLPGVLLACAVVACAGGSGSSSSSTSGGGGTPDAAVANCARGFDASASCVAPCAPGNERFVGEFCTPQGGECDDNLSQVTGAAIFCTVDFEVGANDWFCTKPCEQDSQCGTNAVCTGDPAEDGGRKGCVPLSCN